MKKMLLILMVLASAAIAQREWKMRLNDVINATAAARQILIEDLQDADLGPTVRDWYSGCPSQEQFAKILEDQKRYNAAARRWLKEGGLADGTGVGMRGLLIGTWKADCKGTTVVFQTDGTNGNGQKWDIENGIYIETDGERRTYFKILLLTKHEFLAQDTDGGHSYLFFTRTSN